MNEIFLITGFFDRFAGVEEETTDNSKDNEEYSLEEYLDLLNEYKVGEAEILINIATLYFEEENLKESLIYLENAIQIYDELGYVEKKGLVMDIMGDIYNNSGEERTALEYYKEAYKLYSETDSDNIDYIVNKINETERNLKPLDEKPKKVIVKKEDLPHADIISDDYKYISKDIEDVIEILKGANTYISYTKSENPMEELRNAYEMSNGIGDTDAKGTIQMIMGDFSLKNSKPVEALTEFKNAQENFKLTNNKTGEAVSMLLIGTTYYITGNMDEVPENFRKSIALLREIKDISGEEKAIKLMNSIYEE